MAVAVKPAVSMTKSPALISWGFSPVFWVRRRMTLARATTSRGLKGLGDIVVGADFQAYEAVCFFVTGRQHQDRYIAFFAHLAAYFQTVDFRQHKVKHDNVRSDLEYAF